MKFGLYVWGSGYVISKYAEDPKINRFDSFNNFLLTTNLETNTYLGVIGV